jgi:hypothetical protein
LSSTEVVTATDNNCNLRAIADDFSDLMCDVLNRIGIYSEALAASEGFARQLQ